MNSDLAGNKYRATDHKFWMLDPAQSTRNSDAFVLIVDGEIVHTISGKGKRFIIDCESIGKYTTCTVSDFEEAMEKAEELVVKHLREKAELLLRQAAEIEKHGNTVLWEPRKRNDS